MSAQEKRRDLAAERIADYEWPAPRWTSTDDITRENAERWYVARPPVLTGTEPDPFAIAPIGTLRGDDVIWPESVR